MQRYFYSPAMHSYKGIYPAAGHAQVWPYSQALWATLELARLPRAGVRAFADLPARIAGLRAYGKRTRGGIVYYAVYGEQTYLFYDDNAWISLALIDASDLMRSPALLAVARQVFRPIEAGWDSKPGDSCPGGVYWIRSTRNDDRAAVSTANGALIGVLLYRRTHTSYYLDWARRAYNWLQRCLGTPTGLVADHIDSAGTVETHTWSYNQGAMIAAGVNLYLATHDRRYLDDAETTADAELAALRDPLNSGEPASFLAIFYRDLLELAAVDPSPHYRAAVESFANAAWTQARHPHTNLFYFGHTHATLLDQAAMVQIYAALAAT
jgi:predicted alpha-1,6-mannanase (GH76 family)